MPRAKKTRFDERGDKCPTDPQLLKLHPECGAVNRDVFKPSNKPRPPEPSRVSQYKMKGLTGPLNERLPKKMADPTPHYPQQTRRLIGGPVREKLDLPQDQTNYAVPLDPTGIRTQFKPKSVPTYRPVSVAETEMMTPARPAPAEERLFNIGLREPRTSARRRQGFKFSPRGRSTRSERKRLIESPPARQTRNRSTRTPPNGNGKRRSISEYAREKARRLTGEAGASYARRYHAVETDIRAARTLDFTSTQIEMEEFDTPRPSTDPGPSRLIDIMPEIETHTTPEFEEMVRASEPLDFDPLSEVRTMQGTQDLQFENRMSALERRGLQLKGIAEAHGVDVAAGGAGLLAGVGTSIALQGTGINRFGNDAISGAVGDVSGRILAMTAERAALGVGEVAATSVARGIAFGAAEGAGLGVVGGLADYGTEELFINELHTSHAAAGGVGAAVGGAAATGTAALAGLALGLAPETLGLSVVMGGLITAGSAVAGAVMGAQQDDQIKEAKATAISHLNTVAEERQKLLATLPSHGYDFDNALHDWLSTRPGNSIGYGDETWKDFEKIGETLFTQRPGALPAPSQPQSGDDQLVASRLNKYIQHELSKDPNYHGKDPGNLTDDERRFLDEKTEGLWKTQADMQVELSKQSMSFTRKRIQDAQQAMLDAWNKDQKLPDELDPYTVKTAYLDPSFKAKFTTAMKLDAQRRVIDAFYNDQTTLEELPPNIQKAAMIDPTFKHEMDNFYKSIDDTAKQIQVTVPQMLELQGLKGDAQKQRYKRMQFDRVKEQGPVVQSAQTLADKQDSARSLGFYDIDAEFLELRDPTQAWQPSDAQILQAHNLGMNLNQYVAYIHELAKGDAGNFDGLPKYTQAELRQYGLEDAAHLRDELQLSGRDPNMYSYDPKTRQFKRNDALSGRRLDGEFVSQYTPDYLKRGREEYADMVHGLNAENQAKVDEANAQIHEQLSVYGRNYNRTVSAENNALMRQPVLPSHLLHFSVENAYNQEKLTYDPLSDKLYDAGKHGAVTSASDVPQNPILTAIQNMANDITSAVNEAASQMVVQQQRDEVSAKKLGLQTAEQYRSVQEELASNNQLSPTHEQVQQAVQDTLRYGTETPLRGS